MIDTQYVAYRHMDGTIHVKRYTPAIWAEIQDSDFVEFDYGPYSAPSRAEAERIAQEQLAHRPEGEA